MPQCPSKFPEGNARVLDYVAGRLDTYGTAEMALHLRHCEACRQVVAEQSALWTVLEDWTPESADPGFNRAVYARVDRLEAETLGSRFARAIKSWVPRPALTIPVATMILLGSFYLGRPVIAPEPTAPATTAQSVTANDAEQLKNALDDLQLLHQLDLVKDEAPDASRSM